uniref:Winged helix DNA-binding domain-containing protein n=1 Tax=Thermosporothrix sp. COM3 TaxID=2490863 RepID=A0A455SCD8_9CHLR|nr:hypothetical protein KTC_01770 [Thermosporothrix sp. COM3]
MEQDNDLLLRIRWWSYQRQRLGQAAASMEEVLQDVVGVYSSHPSAPLSLLARTAAFSPEAFRALDLEKKAVRIPAMRRAIYLLLAEDAAFVFAATRENNERLMKHLDYAARYSKHEHLSRETYPQLKAALLAAAQEPLTPKQLGQALNQAKGTAMMAHFLGYEGATLRIGAHSLRSNSLRYVSTEAWGIELQCELSPEEARRQLAYRYFRAFGPASVRDFRWWAGIPADAAAAAVAQLETVTLPNGLLLLAEDLAAFEQVAPLPADAIDILPIWDSYTMGYAPSGHARQIEPAMQAHVYNNPARDGGDGIGSVLLAGKMVASWSSTFTGNHFNVTLDLFDTTAEAHMSTIQARFEEIATALGGTTCTITPHDPSALPLAVAKNRMHSAASRKQQ